MSTASEGREREIAGSDQRQGRIPADTLPNRLTLARKLAGLSIREAADLCGYGRGAWTNWEHGARPLDYLEVTGVIAERLDIDLDWLRFGGPLAGPRGREVRSVAKRVREDTDQYSRSTVRPTSARPRAGRPNNRRETHVSHTPRPTVVFGPTSARSDLVPATR